MKKNYLVDAWLVIALSLGFGLALAAVQLGLMPIIKRNQLNFKSQQVPTMIPGSVRGEGVDVKDFGQVFAAVAENGQKKGWVVSGRDTGFAGTIEMLIGLDASAEHILSIRVVDQKETPGLGDFITKPDFQQRFEGKSTLKPLRVIKSKPGDPQEVEAITGATISSKAVVKIVNATVENFRSKMPGDAPAHQE